MSKKVLDVGQCGFDHGRISHYLSMHFDVQVAQAHSHAEAISMLSQDSYDLILVNRLLDADKSEGMAVIESIKSTPETKDLPVMLVSNFDDAQEKAVEAGAVPGFGKAALDEPESIQRMAEYLK